MSRNQVNFIIGAVCVFILLGFALAFHYISSQKDPSLTQAKAASEASGPEIITLGEGVSAPLEASAPQDSGRLAQLFNLKIIGSNKKTVEAITGKPVQANEFGMSEYELDGCNVSAVYDGNKLKNIGLLLSPTCRVSLASFGIPNTEAGPNLTFGQIEEALGAGSIRKFQASCLIGCGNAADPTVSALYAIDSNPDEFQPLEIQLETVQVGDAALNAAEKWSKTMVDKQGEDWVLNGEYNCEDRYNYVAQQLFNNVEVHAITIGYDIATETCQSAAG